MNPPILTAELERRGLQMLFLNGATKRWVIRRATGDKKVFYSTPHRSDLIFAARALIESGKLPPPKTAASTGGDSPNEIRESESRGVATSAA